ncbi:hypothetical protein [Dactylosporangium fulvum]|uniref:CBM2 domain-containing protein n=1 Tax=Dactylosporangium fulvum TaxID=53359 RepID=A0ABY5W7W3_9ACTN|nr:hypothetical protein [Dactylosporangium fulvum]UWP85445.1 hypothetical protein Dfulv_14875 [Dactylosporangium fulvum]
MTAFAAGVAARTVPQPPGRHRAQDPSSGPGDTGAGDNGPGNNGPGDGGRRARWLSVGIGFALLALFGALAVIYLPRVSSPTAAGTPAASIPALSTNIGGSPVAGGSTLAAPSPPASTTEPSTIPPSVAASPPAQVRTNAPESTSTAPAPPPPPPAPSLTVDTSGSHCTGWPEMHGWTIAVRVTVHNGTGVSATGWHDRDSNAPARTYALSGSGTSFSGEIPPNQGGNPELTDPSKGWRVTVQLQGGGTVTKTGVTTRPSAC